jgi:site-specific recombinase XerD
MVLIYITQKIWQVTTLYIQIKEIGMDIYNTKQYYQKEKKEIEKWNTSESNKKHIFSFLCKMENNGLSFVQLCKYIFTLKRFVNVYDKNFEDVTSEDIDKFLSSMNGLKQKTKKIRYYCLKKFLTFIGKEKIFENNGIVFKSSSKKLPEEILTQEEIERMVNACDSVRDKAIVSVLYESGARIGEFLSMKIKDIHFDNYGAVIIIPDGKTGSRRIRVVNSAQLLKSWLSVHPFKDNPESYVWITKFNRKNRGKGWDVMSEQAVNQLLKNVSKNAGINKKVYPHLLRHSRATHLASFLTEAQMKEFFGWTQSSNMASVYVHLSGRDVDNALLKVYGLKKEEDKPEKVMIKFEELKADFSTEKMLQLESLVIEFLKAIAQEMPSVKEKFREIVRQKNMERLFE